ncbi:MAG: DUF4389 domain-containing protein [Gammaproteobacteria bacterium]|nr:DUF4389 domain-containing protein [Gammaproteobacteria bacterium]
MMHEDEKPYKDRSVWMRGLYMLIFLFFLGIAKFVAFVVILFQFLTVLFTTEPNKQLLSFGESLSLYHYQVMMFLTYNSEDHPFPMGDWPEVSEKNISKEI